MDISSCSTSFDIDAFSEEKPEESWFADMKNTETVGEDFETTELKKIPTTLSKMLKKTHKKLNTFMIPTKENTAIIKAMFGPAGGEVSCCNITLSIPEGACPTKALECCFLICKEATEFAPLTRGESLVSPILTISPFIDIKFNVPVELKIPYSRNRPNKFDKLGKLVRWTATEPGEKPDWHDFLPQST